MKRTDIVVKSVGVLQNVQKEGSTGCVSIWLMNRLRQEKGDWSKIFLTSGTRVTEVNKGYGYENN